MVTRLERRGRTKIWPRLPSETPISECRPVPGQIGACADRSTTSMSALPCTHQLTSRGWKQIADSLGVISLAVNRYPIKKCLVYHFS
jgi:hypothetical protein